MKTIMTYGCWALISALPASVTANQQLNERNNEKTWTGTLVAVNTQDNTVAGRNLWITRTFNLGSNCAISALDKKEAALKDLRPGEKVKVWYQNAEGVLVADRITEKALRYGGTVHAVDAKAGTVTMAQAPLYQPFRAPKTFHLAADGKVILRDGSNGRLADVQPGDRVTVIYELPQGSPVASWIRDDSQTFVGAIDAIDLSARTVKAKAMFGEKKFDLAHGCEIVIPGKPGSSLRSLALGRSYKFTYENVQGVNVVHQIAPAPEARPAETTSIR